MAEKCESDGIKKALIGWGMTIVAALVLQSVTAIYWAGSIGARMTSAENQIERLCDRLDRMPAVRP